MSKQALRWAAIACLVTLMVGCRAPAGQSGASATTTVSVGAAQQTPESTPGANNLAVTLDNDGQTVRLVVGQRILLNLGEGYNWTITLADDTVVSRVVNITVIRGAQGVYEAHKVGSTVLDAVGDPVCRTAQPPCERPSRTFHVDIVVQ